jgi:hypothetical protein
LGSLKYRQIFTVGSLLAAAAFVTNYDNLREIFTDNGVLASSVAKSNYRGDLLEDYVEREGLEKAVTYEMTKTPNKKYCIVYGNKGVGKSSVVSQCAAGKKGYVRVLISSDDDVEKSLMQVLSLGKIHLAHNQLEEEIHKVHHKYGIYPVIVFEVEVAGIPADRDVINNVRSIAKDLAHLCNVLIVLSDPNAITYFGRDPTREEYIFVDELSIPEATAYLKKHLPGMTAEEMKVKVFDQIGTNPGSLHNLTNSFKQYGIPIETFVDETVESARNDLGLFPLQPILKALKALPDPGDGVDPESFKSQQGKGIELCNIHTVSEVLNKIVVCRNPILYRMDTRNYHLLSTAHKTALKVRDPKLPPTRTLA